MADVPTPDSFESILARLREMAAEAEALAKQVLDLTRTQGRPLVHQAMRTAALSLRAVPALLASAIEAEADEAQQVNKQTLASQVTPATQAAPASQVTPSVAPLPALAPTPPPDAPRPPQGNVGPSGGNTGPPVAVPATAAAPLVGSAATIGSAATNGGS